MIKEKMNVMKNKAMGFYCEHKLACDIALELIIPIGMYMVGYGIGHLAGENKVLKSMDGHDRDIQSHLIDDIVNAGENGIRFRNPELGKRVVIKATEVL